MHGILQINIILKYNIKKQRTSLFPDACVGDDRRRFVRLNYALFFSNSFMYSIKASIPASGIAL